MGVRTPEPDDVSGALGLEHRAEMAPDLPEEGGGVAVYRSTPGVPIAIHFMQGPSARWFPGIEPGIWPSVRM